MRRSLPHSAGRRTMPAGMHGLRSGAGGSLPPRGRLGFFTCIAWLFLALGRLWRWVVDGSCFRLPCCQVQGEGGSETYAYGYNRPSRAKTEREHVVSPAKGWRRIQRVCLAYTRGTDPKWTAYKRNQVIRKYGPWMDLDGTPGPEGLRSCIWVCQNLQPGQRVPGFTAKKRHQAAWTYGPYLTRANVKKLLDY